jgi:Glycosyl transferase family 2
VSTLKSLLNKSYVTAKQMTGLWKFVTRFERKFYRRGTFNIAKANVLIGQRQLQNVETLLSGPMPDYLKPAVSIVRANMCVATESDWLFHLNNYVSHYHLAPVSLVGTKSRFCGLSAGFLPVINDGPLISVIMTAHNSAATVGVAVRSLLNQTWQNLQLIVVDDASTDDTPGEILKASAGDRRVKLMSIGVNVGPYVCKNLVLQNRIAEGAYITCHDADDWAHPQRLANHVALASKHRVLDSASVALCLRMRAEGQFTRIGEPRTSRPDGVAQVARVSCLFDRDLLFQRLGFWDCAKFGADSELIGRTEYLLGRRLKHLPSLAMICLDSNASLSSDRRFGVLTSNGLSPTRKAYKKAYEMWHAGLGRNGYLDFPTAIFPFPRPSDMNISEFAIEQSIKDFHQIQ